MRIFLAAFLVLTASLVSAYATTLEQERINTEAGVRREVMIDLAAQYIPPEDRSGLDGRSVNASTDEILEYWVDMECAYCDISQAALAQRENVDFRIIVRHYPTQGEAVKKALIFEALKSLSPSAASRFWQAVSPKTKLDIPVPYALALQTAMAEAVLDAEKFSEQLDAHATKIVNEDLATGHERITSTPTWILAGIRFPSCDFTAVELKHALALAKKARSGDKAATDEVITIITKEILEGAEEEI